jgi:hypothetical protein
MLRTFAIVIIADLVCAAMTALAVSVAADVAAGAAIIFSNDPGGPMFLPIAAMAGLAAAAIVSGALFTATLAVDGLRRVTGARWWKASVIAVPAVSAASALTAFGLDARPLVWLVSGACAFAAFGAYWHACLIAQFALERIVDAFFAGSRRDVSAR